MAYAGYWQFASDSAYVAATDTDFIAIYDLSNIPTSQWSSIDSDGGNLYVTDGSDTEYPFYVFDIDTGAETGWIIFKMPTISSSSNTNVRIHIDDSSRNVPAVTATYGRNNVFSNCIAAYLFQESSGNGVDLTGNGHSIVWSGSPTQGATGLYGNCTELINGFGNTAASDWGFISHDSSFNPATTTEITWEIIVKNKDDYVSGFPDLAAIFEKGTTSGTNYYTLLFRGGTSSYNGFYGRIANGTTYQIDSDTDVRSTINTNDWRHYGMVYSDSDSGNELKIYFEGNNEGSTSVPTATSGTGGMWLGRVIGNSYPFDGYYQLFIIHDDSLSDDQMTTVYNNRMDNSNFWTSGTWVPAGGGSSFRPRLSVI